jgi:hypothetical protein
MQEQSKTFPDQGQMQQKQGLSREWLDENHSSLLTTQFSKSVGFPAYTVPKTRHWPSMKYPLDDTSTTNTKILYFQG